MTEEVKTSSDIESDISFIISNLDNKRCECVFLNKELFKSVIKKSEGLWLEAGMPPEAYLQQELRKLHAITEDIGK